MGEGADQPVPRPYQAVRIAHAVHNGTFLGGIFLAWELTEVIFYYGVVALLLKALWASGKPEKRTIGG